jgi:hypothetical protein
MPEGEVDGECLAGQAGVIWTMPPQKPCLKNVAQPYDEMAALA